VMPPGPPSYGRVQTIESPPIGPRAYVSIPRISWDFEPHVYKPRTTANPDRLTTEPTAFPPTSGGWWRIRPLRLLRRTEFGMPSGPDDGAHWQSFQLNLR
jgi:hypothetical protein